MCERAGRSVTMKTIDRDRLDEELNDDVALVELTQVDYRSGEALDMATITEKVHAAGALMLWDFAHSAGAVPLDVTAADVDFAAGCGYKYLNGGPGAPAFLYVRKSWQGKLRNPLPGWLGHARPFDFELTYEPAEGMQAFVTSSPSIVALRPSTERLTCGSARRWGTFGPRAWPDRPFHTTCRRTTARRL